ncbi:MAG: hypothetical protein AMXMBFR23_03870 [Chloroflexota bacterium]
MSIQAEVEALRLSIGAVATGTGASVAADMAKAVTPLHLWIRHFRVLDEGSPSTVLLDGAHAATIESVAYGALGLVRSAITAIRLQIDLLVGYSYYRTHPEEWLQVDHSGKGYSTRGAIQAFHEETVLGFKARLGMLRTQGSDVAAPYRILSAHIHGQSSLSIPRAASLAGVVSDPTALESVLTIQEQVAEGLSDYLVALYATAWPELPTDVVRRTAGRLTNAQRVVFFDSPAAARP